MVSENKLQDVIRTSLENIKNLVDSDTIIGTPIETKAGTTLIPISKISVGLATGGVDATNEKPVFGGGGGTGLSIIWVCRDLQILSRRPSDSSTEYPRSSKKSKICSEKRNPKTPKPKRKKTDGPWILFAYRNTFRTAD